MQITQTTKLIETNILQMNIISYNKTILKHSCNFILVVLSIGLFTNSKKNAHANKGLDPC